MPRPTVNKIVAIIQARMGSSRFPGKTMIDLAGEPLLARVIRRVRRAGTLAETIIATTTEPTDDVIATFCHEHGTACFRGSENDVLDRYYRAACQHHAHAVVRITADCPLIDPGLIDSVVELFIRSEELDYASNVFPHRRYPRGLDTEIVRFDVLEKLWRETSDPTSREHVTAFIHRHPDQFRTGCVSCPHDYSHMRWTVDTEDDFELIRRIYEHFRHDAFSWKDVLALLQDRPDWLDINRHVKQKEP